MIDTVWASGWTVHDDCTWYAPFVWLSPNKLQYSEHQLTHWSDLSILVALRYEYGGFCPSSVSGLSTNTIRHRSYLHTVVVPNYCTYSDPFSTVSGWVDSTTVQFSSNPSIPWDWTKRDWTNWTSSIEQEFEKIWSRVQLNRFNCGFPWRTTHWPLIING